jgi:hypothetical protein
MTVVAISASYGAAGSVIGPELARRLEVPFLDRAIPIQVAAQLDVSVDDATAHDWKASTRRAGRCAGSTGPTPSTRVTSTAPT